MIAWLCKRGIGYVLQPAFITCRSFRPPATATTSLLIQSLPYRLQTPVVYLLVAPPSRLAATRPTNDRLRRPVVLQGRLLWCNAATEVRQKWRFIHDVCATIVYKTDWRALSTDCALWTPIAPFVDWRANCCPSVAPKC